MRCAGWIAVLAGMAGCAAWAPGALAPYRVDGDAIREPLAAAGDAARGKAVVTARDSNCLLCHAVSGSGVRVMGNVGPPLDGVGRRLTEGQLRLRIVDSMRLNRDTLMPSYYRVDGLNQVAEAWRGKPVLTAQQVEDAVAFLITLR
ncbi:MAG TPA: sulfur oxidation c-type cytochrome SoxX [Burkholderiales bacterium]|nr:sulfur oxidation c-type cytochrome SoxX [Burkholderiales bacterium]